MQLRKERPLARLLEHSNQRSRLQPARVRSSYAMTRMLMQHSQHGCFASCVVLGVAGQVYGRLHKCLSCLKLQSWDLRSSEAELEGASTCLQGHACLPSRLLTNYASQVQHQAHWSATSEELNCRLAAFRFHLRWL